MNKLLSQRLFQDLTETARVKAREEARERELEERAAQTTTATFPRGQRDGMAARQFFAASVELERRKRDGGTKRPPNSFVIARDWDPEDDPDGEKA